MFKDEAHIIEVVYRVLPYSNQIRNLKIGDGSITFTWRGTDLRVIKSCHVHVMLSNSTTCSGESILLEELIKIFFNNAKINETGD